jgi:hypothetical protein
MAGPVLLPSPQRQQPALTFGVACLALAALASSGTASCPAMPACTASSIVACPASGAPGADLAEHLADHHRQLLTAEEWQQLGCERSLAGRRADHSHLCVSRGGIVPASRRADRILFVLGVKRVAAGGGFAAASFLVPRRLRGRCSGPIRVLRIALRATGLRPPADTGA